MPDAGAASLRPSALGLGEDLDGLGLNLAGVLPIAAYDAAVPAAWRSQELLRTARSAIVLAAGGDALVRRHRAAGVSAALDEFVARAVGEACARLTRSGWHSLAFGYDEMRGGCHVDLVALAVRAGLGGHSRLGLLVHREYGPWLSLRALVLSERGFEGPTRPAAFEPCAGCEAPCADACPVGAPRPLPGGFDVGVCAGQRMASDACRQRCAARRACVFGAEHAYAADVEASLMAASLPRMAAAAGARGPVGGEP